MNNMLIPQITQVDIPGVFQAGAALEQNKLRSQMLQRQIDQDAKAEARQNKLLDLMPKAVGGDKGALNEVAAVDIDKWGQVNEYLAKADDRQRAQLRQRNEAAAKLLSSVKDPQSYAIARQRAAQAGMPLDNVPDQYDPAWVESAMTDAMTMDQILKRAEIGAKAPTMHTFREGMQDVSKQWVPGQGWVEQSRGAAFKPGSGGDGGGGGSGGGIGGPFEGKGMAAQDSNILLRGDPASPEYEMAYRRQFMQPKYVEGSNGLVPVMMPPPSGIRKPASMMTQPQPGGEQPAPQAAPAPTAGPPIPGTNKQRLSATQEKELFEADDTVRSSGTALSNLEAALGLSEKAAAGVTAPVQTFVNRNLGDGKAAAATSEFDSLMKGQALESLKTIFGGAPTEGERKILLETQGVSTMSRPERDALIRRALVAVKNREQSATAKAKALRGGTYMTQGPEAPQGQGKGTTTPALPPGFAIIGE